MREQGAGKIGISAVQPRFMGIHKVAELFDVSDSTIRQACNAKRIASHKILGRRVIAFSEVERLIREGEQPRHSSAAVRALLIFAALAGISLARSAHAQTYDLPGVFNLNEAQESFLGVSKPWPTGTTATICHYQVATAQSCPVPATVYTDAARTQVLAQPFAVPANGGNLTFYGDPFPYTAAFQDGSGNAIGAKLVLPQWGTTAFGSTPGTFASGVDARIVGAVQRETRTLQVQTIEPTVAGSPDPIPAGGTATLFSATGAGSVERIQFAVIGDNPTWQDSTITIAVDGRTYTVPMGIFFLTYGYGDIPPNVANFETKNLAVTFSAIASTPTTYPIHTGATNADGSPASYEANGAQYGGYRKIYIPFSSSLTITYNNTSGSAAQIFTQVDYYSGAPPIGLHPPRQNVFRMYASPALGSLAAYTSTNWLPPVSGAGEIESIYFFVLGIAQGAQAGIGGLPTWLEGNPTVAVDGKTWNYGGTEDFFGCQFYCTGLTARTDEMGVGLISSSSTNSNTYTSFYRYFRDYPLIFNSSIAMTWQNGQVNENPQPPTVKWSDLVVYYTVN